ncbi:MAG: glycosyltransferase family 2 protein [Nitrospiraceae bacterium]
MTVTSRPWVSVVIPIKDERDNLPPLTEQLLKVLSARSEFQNAPFEILYVDDGSTDGSSALLDNLTTQYAEVKVLHFDRNYGQTSAFDAGFRQAHGELVVTMDGDLQFDPADILRLLPLASQYDLVCGWRKDRHDNLIRKLSSLIAYLVRSSVTGDFIHDTGCSLKVFRRTVVEKMCLFEGMHRFFPVLAQMHGFLVTEVPVTHFPRAHGYSKYGVGNRLFKGLYDLIAVRWMQSRCLRYRFRPSERHP